MEKLISNFTNHISEAISICNNTKLKKNNNSISNIIICGMGGSGISASIVFNYLKHKISVPYYINKSYSLPKFADKNSLIIICSYSGNTEETLSCFKNALKLKGEICCLSSNGFLVKESVDKQINHMVIPGGNPPRTMIAFSIIFILNVLKNYSIYRINIETTFNKIITKLQQPTLNKLKNKAKKISEKIKNTIPVIYTCEDIDGVGVRFKQQLNENSKILCLQNSIPEMNHNEILGWRTKKDKTLNNISLSRFSVIFLRHSDELKRNFIRLNILKNKMKKINKKNVLEINAEGDSYFEELFYLVHLCDWISYFLALKNNVDPVNIDEINMFKKELARY